MKEYEREMLHHLRRGRKMNISEIARLMRIPVTTAIDRVKRIEERYMLKHSLILDYEKAGYYSPAIIAMRVDDLNKDNLLGFLKIQKQVNSIYRTGADHDFLVEVVCKDNLELKTWIEEMKARFSMEMMPFQILKVEDKERFVP